LIRRHSRGPLLMSGEVCFNSRGSEYQWGGGRGGHRPNREMRNGKEEMGINLRYRRGNQPQIPAGEGERESIPWGGPAVFDTILAGGGGGYRWGGTGQWKQENVHVCIHTHIYRRALHQSMGGGPFRMVVRACWELRWPFLWIIPCSFFSFCVRFML